MREKLLYQLFRLFSTKKIKGKKLIAGFSPKSYYRIN